MSNGNGHDRYTPPALVLGGAAGRMKGRGKEHIAVDHKPAVNLLLNLAEMADVPLDKIVPSTG